jgi:hypothetical protein
MVLYEYPLESLLPGFALEPRVHESHFSALVIASTGKQNVMGRVYVLPRQKCWPDAAEAIQHGLAVAEMIDPSTSDQLIALSECLAKNGF